LKSSLSEINCCRKTLSCHRRRAQSLHGATGEGPVLPQAHQNHRTRRDGGTSRTGPLSKAAGLVFSAQYASSAASYDPSNSASRFELEQAIGETLTSIQFADQHTSVNQDWVTKRQLSPMSTAVLRIGGYSANELVVTITAPF
jgi:hypothetical protein